jgi:uncharacterized repeat protein (TIGR01451 family)
VDAGSSGSRWQPARWLCSRRQPRERGLSRFIQECRGDQTAGDPFIGARHLIASTLAAGLSLAGTLELSAMQQTPPDLTITKSHTGNFIQGQPGIYTLTVSNAGGSSTTGVATVIDNLPAVLVPTAAGGTGWSCEISGQGVHCARSDPLARPADIPASNRKMIDDFAEGRHGEVGRRDNARAHAQGRGLAS